MTGLGTTTVPVAVATTSGSARTTAADGLRAGSARQTTLASNVSSLPAILGDGITFDPYRTESIGAAMLRALRMSAAETDAYRRRCRARAETLFENFARMAPLP